MIKNTNTSEMEILFRKYARLILQVGVHLQKNQKVFVTMEVCHRDFANLLVEEAYKLGAAYVLLELNDPYHLASRIRFSSESNLQYLPSWIEERNRKMVEEGWARIVFYGPDEPKLLEALDQAHLSMVQAIHKRATKPLTRASGKGEVAWTVGVLPTQKWALSVFPNQSPELALKMLWCELINILHLDEDDPVTYWREISRKINQRSIKLEQLEIKQIHFKNSHTDLTVRCAHHAIWRGGGTRCKAGYEFLPNIPTFENFTTPDYRGTSGFVAATRPTEVMGSLIEGAWFKFEQGKVVEYGAHKNQGMLEKMFKMCPRAHYLGEVALVDIMSPVCRSEIVFNSVLLDENASCHIAFGNGYVDATPFAEGMTDSQLLASGCNVSLIHYDFMIGSDDLSVHALLSDDSTVPIIRDGRYTDLLL